MILEKMRSCLWKLEPGFWTYGWIRLLGPSDPTIMLRPQTTRSRYILKFHDFIGFISSFLRKWHPVCENRSQGSGFMAGYVFWVQAAHMYFLSPRPQDQEIFQDFIILLDSSHNSWKNEVLFVKIGARVLELWFDKSFEKSFGPKLP